MRLFRQSLELTYSMNNCKGCVLFSISMLIYMLIIIHYIPKIGSEVTLVTEFSELTSSLNVTTTNMNTAIMIELDMYMTK